jgi:hypothetical protein
MRVVKRGDWQYAPGVLMAVDIIAFPFDFWYEMAREEEQLEPGEVAGPLGEQGQLYYVRFARAGELGDTTWVDSHGHATIEEAMKDAQARVAGDITWY